MEVKNKGVLGKFAAIMDLSSLFDVYSLVVEGDGR